MYCRGVVPYRTIRNVCRGKKIKNTRVRGKNMQVTNILKSSKHMWSKTSKKIFPYVKHFAVQNLKHQGIALQIEVTAN